MKFNYKWLTFIVWNSWIKWWSFILELLSDPNNEYSWKRLVTFRLYKKDNFKYWWFKVRQWLDKNFYKIDDILKIHY